MTRRKAQRAGGQAEAAVIFRGHKDTKNRLAKAISSNQGLMPAFITRICKQRPGTYVTKS